MALFAGSPVAKRSVLGSNRSRCATIPLQQVELHGSDGGYRLQPGTIRVPHECVGVSERNRGRRRWS